MRRRDLPHALFATLGAGLSVSAQCAANSISGALGAEVQIANVLAYGADPSGQRDSSAAFQRACDSGLGTVIVPRGRYRLSAAVSIDVATTELHGQHATIEADVSQGAVLHVTSSSGAEACATALISGLAFGGGNRAGVFAINVEASERHTVASLSISNCSFTSFDTFVRIYSNAYCVNFIGCAFSQGGRSGGVHVPTGGGNYAERITFIGCSFFNNEICLLADYPSTQFHLSECSLDYSHQLVLMNAGVAQLSNCFCENNLDSHAWFVTGPAEATINLNGCTIAQTGDKPNHAIGHSESRSGAINFRNCVLYSGSDVVQSTLVSGDGCAYGSGNRILGFTHNSRAWGAVSATANLCAPVVDGVPGWVHASVRTEPQSSGGDSGRPAVAAEADGDGALRLRTFAGGPECAVYHAVACVAGDNVGVVFKARSGGAPSLLRYQLQAYGSGGTLLAASVSEQGLAVLDAVGSGSPPAQTFHSCYASLPPGTIECRVHFAGGVPVTGEGDVFISDVIIGRY